MVQYFYGHGQKSYTYQLCLPVQYILDLPTVGVQRMYLTTERDPVYTQQVLVSY